MLIAEELFLLLRRDAPKVLEDEKGTLGRRDVERRIEEIATEVKAGDAVARAVAAMDASIMTVSSPTAAVTLAAGTDGPTGIGVSPMRGGPSAPARRGRW